MMGPMKPGEIKERLRQTLGKNKAELEAWIDQQMAKLQPKTEPDPKVVEDLMWIRKLLREEVKDKKPKAGTAKKRRIKKAATA